MQYKDYTTTAQRLTPKASTKDNTASIKDIIAVLAIGVMILLAMSNDFNQLIN